MQAIRKIESSEKSQFYEIGAINGIKIYLLKKGKG